MTNEPIKPINKKQFAFFKGVALALFSIILILNMWYVARAFTFIFVYLFGIASYALFVFIYLEGMSYIFKGKRIGIKLGTRSFGIFLIFLSSLLLLTTFYRLNISLDAYNNAFKALDYIKNEHYLNLFKLDLGGGLIGLSIYRVLNTTHESLPYIIGFFVLVIGLIFALMDQIIAYFNSHSKKEHHEKVKKENNNAVIKDDGVVIVSDNTSDIIKSASILDKTVSTPASRPIINNRPIVNPILNNESMNTFKEDIVDSNLQFKNNGEFIRAHYVKGVNPETLMNQISDEVMPLRPEKIANPFEINKEKENQPVKNEQLTLDFSGPEINEAVVTAQPIFNEPVAVSQRVMPVNELPTEEAPKRKKIKWVPPSSELLELYETSKEEEANRNTAEQRMEAINQIFNDFRIGAEVVGYIIGPSITRYNIKYQPNVSYKNIEAKITDVAIRLGGVNCRFEQVVEGSFYSGLEVPNAVITTVSFKDVYEALPDVKKHPLSVAFGKDIEGKVIYADFDKFPHALVAGSTGSGKSIFIHSVISTLIMRNSPDSLKLVLVDPKKVEMSKYRDLPHLLCPIITDPVKVKPLLDKLVQEMNERYEKLGQNDVTNIGEYNELAEEKGLEKMPYIIGILDEFGDLVQTCKEVSHPVVMLGQKARACGIHLMIATQSPTSDIITGSIKNNLPTHIALATANYTQSITILGEGGAEKLLGKGDMLVQSQLVSRVGLSRLQGCYISSKEISRIANYLREHYETQYDERFLNFEEEAEVEGSNFVSDGGLARASAGSEEEKYQSIKTWVMSNQYMSISRIQRDCMVGFNRAGRFFNRLVQEGVVEATSEGNRGSRVLIHDVNTQIDVDDVPVSDEQTIF